MKMFFIIKLISEVTDGPHHEDRHCCLWCVLLLLQAWTERRMTSMHTLHPRDPRGGTRLQNHHESLSTVHSTSPSGAADTFSGGRGCLVPNVLEHLTCWVGTCACAVSQQVLLGLLHFENTHCTLPIVADWVYLLPLDIFWLLTTSHLSPSLGGAVSAR